MTRCVNGDARTEDAFLRALEGQKAGLLLTDPPYCILERRRKDGELRDPKDRKIERGPLRKFPDVRAYRQFTEEWLPKAIAHLRPGAPLVVWTNFLGKEPLRTVARANGYPHLAGEFVWAKRSTEKDGNELLLRVYEVALVLLPAPLPLPSNEDPPRVWSVVAGYDDDGEAARWGSHPNHKPFCVLEALVRTYSRPNDLVLDCFAGSGSIPAAAVRLGRGTACIELDAGWAARAQERLERLRF